MACREAPRGVVGVRNDFQAPACAQVEGGLVLEEVAAEPPCGGPPSVWGPSAVGEDRRSLACDKRRGSVGEGGNRVGIVHLQMTDVSHGQSSTSARRTGIDCGEIRPPDP